MSRKEIWLKNNNKKCHSFTDLFELRGQSCNQTHSGYTALVPVTAGAAASLI